jgi:hypothetical protein
LLSYLHYLSSASDSKDSQPIQPQRLQEKEEMVSSSRLRPTLHYHHPGRRCCVAIQLFGMTDRLADLKRGAAAAGNGSDGISSERGGKGAGDITMNQLHPGLGNNGPSNYLNLLSLTLHSTENFMQRFFADVEMIKNNLTQIAQTTERLRDIHSEVSLCCHSILSPSTRSWWQPQRKEKSLLPPKLAQFSENQIKEHNM